MQIGNFAADTALLDRKGCALRRPLLRQIDSIFAGGGPFQQISGKFFSAERQPEGLLPILNIELPHLFGGNKTMIFITDE